MKVKSRQYAVGSVQGEVSSKTMRLCDFEKGRKAAGSRQQEEKRLVLGEWAESRGPAFAEASADKAWGIG